DRFWLLFFFQAEDGIRVFHVTGVQTCALPISAQITSPRRWRVSSSSTNPSLPTDRIVPTHVELIGGPVRRSGPPMSRFSGRTARSEERRVGKEWRARWWPQP